jgi:hypothetical protein
LGLKTYSEFEAELKLEIYQRDDLESPTNYYQKWINQSYIALVTRKELYFPELEKSSSATTTDGTAYVESPSDTLFIRTVFDDDNETKLNKISWISYIKKTDRADTDAENKPNKWTRAGGGTGRGRIYLYPTPDDAYDLTVYYRARPSRLSNASDTTAIGEEWDEIILKMAVWQTLMRLKEYEKAKEEKEVVDQMIRDMRGIYDRENIDRHVILQPHQGYLNR